MNKSLHTLGHPNYINRVTRGIWMTWIITSYKRHIDFNMTIEVRWLIHVSNLSNIKDCKLKSLTRTTPILFCDFMYICYERKGAREYCIIFLRQDVLSRVISNIALILYVHQALANEFLMFLWVSCEKLEMGWPYGTNLCWHSDCILIGRSLTLSYVLRGILNV